MSPQELGPKIISLIFPADWFNANPDYLNYFPVPKESVSPEIMGKQTQAIENWKTGLVLVRVTLFQILFSLH